MKRCRTCKKTEEDGVKFYLNKRGIVEGECSVCKSKRTKQNKELVREYNKRLSPDELDFLISQMKWLAKYWGEDPKSREYYPEYHHMIQKLQHMRGTDKNNDTTSDRTIQEVC